MKHFLLSILIIFSCFTRGFAQWGIQPSVTIPTGYNSYLLRPGPMLELCLRISDRDAFYQFGGAVGYGLLRPTADTFRTYAIGNQFLPGYEVIHSYSILSFGATNDINILKNKKCSPVIGLDFYFYVITIAEDDYAESLVNESTTGDSYWLVSINPRIGFRYRLTDALTIAGGCAKSVSILGTSVPLPFIKPYISIFYTPQ